MSDSRDSITESLQDASRFRRLKAYVVSTDGSRMPLDGAAIVVELDDQRGLIIALSERIDGEGVAIRSLPQGCRDVTSPSPTSSHHSLIVMRSGGANLVYVSPQLLGGGRK